VQRLNPTLSPLIDDALRRALSKKPEARFEHCVSFQEELHRACVVTTGWKSLARGGSLSLPTLVESAPQRSRMESPPAREGVRVLPVLGAILVALGLIGLIAWQSGMRPPAPAPMTSAQQPTRQPSLTAQPQPPSDQKKPSALEPAPHERAPKPAEAKQEPRAPETAPAGSPGLSQEVWIPTKPPGATVTMDNRPDTSCRTPCMLQAPPGRHTLAITLPDHQREFREIQVSDTPVVLPEIPLRTVAGILRLSSVPPGASILVDGKPTPQKTPAQLTLSPGTHEVTVEKDGQRKSDRVEVRNGGTSVLRIILSQ